MQNYVDELLDRLRLCHQELAASLAPGFAPNHVYRLLPVGDVTWSRTPFLMVSGLRQTYQQESSTLVTFIQTITVTLVTGPRNADMATSTGESQQVEDTYDVLTAFVEYYFAHPQLHTATLGELGWLNSIRLLSSEPAVLSPNPDDLKIPDYAGIAFTLQADWEHFIENSRWS